MPAAPALHRGLCVPPRLSPPPRGDRLVQALGELRPHRHCLPVCLCPSVCPGWDSVAPAPPCPLVPPPPRLQGGEHAGGLGCLGVLSLLSPALPGGARLGNTGSAAAGAPVSPPPREGCSWGCTALHGGRSRQPWAGIGELGPSPRARPAAPRCSPPILSNPVRVVGVPCAGAHRRGVGAVGPWGGCVLRGAGHAAGGLGHMADALSGSSLHGGSRHHAPALGVGGCPGAPAAPAAPGPSAPAPGRGGGPRGCGWGLRSSCPPSPPKIRGRGKLCKAQYGSPAPAMPARLTSPVPVGLGHAGSRSSGVGTPLA